MKENIANQKGTLRMKMYLIMSCTPLDDQYECDANREPIAIVDDWYVWFKINHPSYYFEVYEWIDDEFKIIKTYTDAVEKGMAFYYWDFSENENLVMDEPHMIAIWSNRTRKNSIPTIVKTWNRNHTQYNYENCLKNMGHITWHESENLDGRYYVYGEYSDGFYTRGI